MIRLKEQEDLEWGCIGEYFGKSGQAARSRYRRIKAKQAAKVPDHVPPEFPDLENPELDVDEWLDQLVALQALRLKAEPHTTVATIRLNTDGRPIAFSPVSCWHLGGLYTNYEEFRSKYRELLQIDRLYWGLHGDEWESFPPGWASTVFLNLVPPHVQRQLVGRIIQQAHDAGKLLYSNWSNHPAFMEKATGEDSAALIFMGKVPYFRGKGIIKLYVDQELYVMSVAHVFPGHSMHNPNHSQGRQLNQVPQADFVIQGDKHTFAYQEKAHRIEAMDAGLQENFIAHLVQTGTAKDGPDPYTMRRWSRGTFIWPVFCLSAKQHAIHKVCDRSALEWYLGREDF